MMTSVKFSRIEFEDNKPKLGRSLSMTILTACLMIIAVMLEYSHGLAISILVIGFAASWAAWPMHYLLGKVMKSGKFAFKGEA